MVDWEKGLTVSAAPPKEPEPRLPPVEALVPDWAKQPLVAHLKHAKKGEKSQQIFRDCLTIIDRTLSDFRSRYVSLAPYVEVKAFQWPFMRLKYRKGVRIEDIPYRDQLRPFQVYGFIPKSLYLMHDTLERAKALAASWPDAPESDKHFKPIEAAHFLAFTIDFVVSVHRKID